VKIGLAPAGVSGHAARASPGRIDTARYASRILGGRNSSLAGACLSRTYRSAHDPAAVSCDFLHTLSKFIKGIRVGDF
jgi:hypothetical protein